MSSPTEAPHASQASGIGSLYGRVMRLVSDHGMFWTRIAHEHPESRMMHWWMRSMMDPFFHQWNLITSRTVTAADVDTLEATIGRLVELRAQAQAFGIPLPPLQGDEITMSGALENCVIGKSSPALDRLVELVEENRTADAQRVTNAYGRLITALDAHERAFTPIRMIVDEIWAPLYTEATSALASARTIDEYKAIIDRTVARLTELRAAAKAAGLPIPAMAAFVPLYPVPPRGVRGRHVAVAVRGEEAMPDTRHRVNLYPKNVEMMVGRHHGGGGGGGGRGRHARGGFGYGRRFVGGTELVDIAPVILPAARGVTVRLDLDGGGQLHASICVDGHCYQAVSDLSAAIAQAPAAANATVKSSGAIMVGSMLEEHQVTMSAGWWSSLKHGASSAVGTIGHTLKKYKGSIAAAAGLAATAAGGPLAGTMATAIVHAATGSGSVKAAAQATIAEAQHVANTNATVAHALDHAYKSVAKTAAAYHVTSTVDEARAGNAAAQQQVADLTTAADAGDPSAQKAVAIANTATEVAAAQGEEAMVSGLIPVSVVLALGTAAILDARHHRTTQLGRWAGRAAPTVVKGAFDNFAATACVIPVVNAACNPTGEFAAWHSTPTQRALFGDQIPSYFNSDAGSFLFLADNRRDLLAYRPTWRVTICDEEAAA